MRGEQFLWVEKYRPKSINECVLPSKIRTTVKAYLDKGEIPHFLFAGQAGTGKTTLARAIVDELNTDMLFINGSKDNGIDVLRTTITQFASTRSLEHADKPKIVLIDEADFLNANSIQPALRAFMEEYAKTCRFIFTANAPNRIIQPIRESRMVQVDFVYPEEERKELKRQFFAVVKKILEAEDVEYDKKAVAHLINLFFPDFRRILNMLQSYSVTGKIDVGVVMNANQENSLAPLIEYLRNKDYKSMREWIAEHNDIPIEMLARDLYDSLYDLMDFSAIPLMVEIIDEYLYRAAFVADQEINKAAFLGKLMANAVFKK